MTVAGRSVGQNRSSAAPGGRGGGRMVPRFSLRLPGAKRAFFPRCVRRAGFLIQVQTRAEGRPSRGAPTIRAVSGNNRTQRSSRGVGRLKLIPPLTILLALRPFQDSGTPRPPTTTLPPWDCWRPARDLRSSGAGAQRPPRGSNRMRAVAGNRQGAYRGLKSGATGGRTCRRSRREEARQGNREFVSGCL